MDELLYKPGDVVIIRSDLKGNRYYPILYGKRKGEGVYCNPDMVQYAGKTFEIIEIEQGVYKLKTISYWNWTESMFEDQNECVCTSLL